MTIYYMVMIVHDIVIMTDALFIGAELMRLLTNHPLADVKVLTADRSAGQEFKTIYPQFAYRKGLPLLTKWEDSQKEIEQCDIVFCCLPHGTTQEIIGLLAKRLFIHSYLFH
jgi:N-acetyl-gamma-glutamyl-phosphate reductase